MRKNQKVILMSLDLVLQASKKMGSRYAIKGKENIFRE